MERIYNDNNIKLYKLMALSGAISPINNSPVRLYNHPRRSPDFDSRANSNVLSSLENLDSPIVRFYRSGSPLSAIENLENVPQSNLPKTVFKTQVKVEEDVLVMDGILVGPVTGRRVRSLSSTPDTGGSSSSGGKSLYKTEICRSWEDIGSCRYGAKCQFAHGKEELRPVQFFNKSKLQTQICRSYSSGSCSYGSKGCFIHQQNNSPASGTDSPFSVTSLTTRIMSQNNSPASATDSPVSVIPSKTLTVSPITLEKAINWAGSSSSTTRTVSPIELQNAMNSSESSCFTFASTDWSPLDDGIEVALPCSSSTDKTLSREEVDAYITSVLYGSNKRKTLPVFAAICPR